MKKLACLIVLLAPIAGAQDWMATSYIHTEVSPGIYLLTGADGKMAGGNVGLLVGDEYVVLIDDGFTPTGPALLGKIDELAGRPADFLITTHAHGDHTGANQLISEQGTIIVAHDNQRGRIENDEQQNTGPGALPVITFSSEMTFHINGGEAYVFHPGNAHTDGDAAILFRDANVIAAGDLLFRGMFPFIDLDSGGTLEGYKTAMEKVISMSDDETRIIAGHGPVASRSDMQQDLDMLIDGERRVQSLLDDGQSAEEILAANPLADYHEDYNWSFITTERMTRTLIRALSGGE